jgi:hypothetical protein
LADSSWTGVRCIQDVAVAENINPSYISRVLRMTLLAPDIVEAILAGTQPAGLTRAKVMKPFPAEWKCQSFASLCHRHQPVQTA